MPLEESWNTFFNVELILEKLQINGTIQDVVEFGSGYGTFTIPASLKIKGKIFDYDIEPEMIKCLQDKINQNNLSNIILMNRDFLIDGTGLDDNSVDYVMMFNILHAEEPLELLKESYRILKYNGKIGIIHWIYSKDTPRGPSMEIRPTEKQCIEWANISGFNTYGGSFSLPPYHYGIIGIKK